MAALACRDPRLWPWSAASIWNTPIGRAADYRSIGLFADPHPLPDHVLHGDEDILVQLSPDDPSTPWFKQGWWGDPGGEAHCEVKSAEPYDHIPFPADAIYDHWGHNNGAGIVAADNRTLLVETQPLYRCKPDSPILSLKAHQPNRDLVTDNGTLGAHGGSGLSAVGGTLKWWELEPGSPGPRHALKLELFAREYYLAPRLGPCYRWPAIACDGYAGNASSRLVYNGTNPLVTPGALLAIPPAVAAALPPNRTEPGGLIRRALERFGGYLVDDTACNRFTVSVEWGLQERYAAAYPHLAPFEQNSGPFFDDLLEAFQALHVVANNAPETPGGGGGSSEPPPPPFCSPWATEEVVKS